MARRGKSSHKRASLAKQKFQKSEQVPGGFIAPPSGDRAVVSVEYGGPIPPPAMMSAFGDIQGDFPDRIMAMAERQQKHEIEERRYINRTIGGTIKRSQIFAFILLFIMIVGGGLLIYEGFDIAGYLVLVPSIITTLIQVLRVFPRSPETK